MKITLRAEKPWNLFPLKEWVHFRFVLSMLIVRDIKLRYKHTVLGIVWVLIQPLLTACLLAFIFGRAIGPSKGEASYFLFAYCGLIPWLTFSQALNRAHTSLLSDTRLITKVYFPRIFLPLSATFGLGLDFLITLSTFFILKVVYGGGWVVHFGILLLATLTLFTFSIGVNLLVSILSVFIRDLKHIIPFLIQFWLLASPLAYGVELVPKSLLPFYLSNPLAGIIEGFRIALLGGEIPTSLMLAGGISGSLLLAALFLFQKLEPHISDHL